MPPRNNRGRNNAAAPAAALPAAAAPPVAAGNAAPAPNARARTSGQKARPKLEKLLMHVDTAFSRTIELLAPAAKAADAARKEQGEVKKQWDKHSKNAGPRRDTVRRLIAARGRIVVPARILTAAERKKRKIYEKKSLVNLIINMLKKNWSET